MLVIKNIVNKLKSEKGSAVTTEFIILIIILLVVLFGAIDYWIMLGQFQRAEHIKNQYLETAKLKGCLESTDIKNLTTILEDGMGYKDVVVELVDARDQSIKYDENNRAIRMISGSIEDIPEIKLEITGKVPKKAFWISDILSSSEGVGEMDFKLEGYTFTEYIDREG